MCGIAGVFGHPNASEYAFLQIYSLQHRGQESVGISSSDGKKIHTVKKPGRVLEAIRQEDLDRLPGNMAVAHVRYSTSGDSGVRNAQPIVGETSIGEVAVVHNGNITNYLELRRELEKEGIDFKHTSDTELFIALLKTGRELVPDWVDLDERDEEVLPKVFYALSRLEGAFSFLMLTKDRLIAGRDPYGFRPLLVGIREGTLLFASESCAFDVVEGSILREVKPGEVLVVDEEGMRSYFPFEERKKAMCVFEFVYFARPDSFIFGEWAYSVRKEFGRQLAREDDVEADVVVPVPDSGVVPAIGYAEERNMPFEMGIIRNHYVGRSFIEPTQELRNLRVLMKLSPNRAVIEGKRLVVIDDSLVRGTTSKRIVSMLRRAGAKEIHLRIASPPVVGPCYYGIDTPSREELIANRMSLDEIRDFVGVDSIKYLSLEGLRSCLPSWEDFCDACFSNSYPTKVEKIAVFRRR